MLMADSDSDGSWVARAACRGLTAVMFPQPGRRPQPSRVLTEAERASVEVCGKCGVVAECRGLVNSLPVHPGKVQGTWAAETERQRNVRRAGGGRRRSGSAATG